MEAKVRVAWYGKQLEGKLEAAAFQGVMDAAQIVREKIQVNISVVGPPHSLPGEAPHLISGDLQDSVKIKSSRRKVEAWVVVEADYALALELGYAPRNLEPRPYIVRSLHESKQEAVKAVVTPMRRVLRGNG